MWQLDKIHIENIVSFKEADFEFKQEVCTLIFGHNEDNAAQPCNGSGKSSLIEAISFALTGDTLRKVKTDEIINDEADEALVCLAMINDFNGKRMEITRQISRKSAQVVTCLMTDEEGNVIEEDKTVQPTVADYNKMILDEIGLSKDEIYSYFILCDNKYKSFFDSSDKDKKEIINRFSNGVMVDESIEKVKEDMEPVASELKDAIADQMEIQGAISALEEQLKTADEKNANQKANREAKLAEYDAKIAELRSKKREENERLQKAQERMNVLRHLLYESENLNAEEWSMDELQVSINTQCKTHNLQLIKDYCEESKLLKSQIHTINVDIENKDGELQDANKLVEPIQNEYEGVRDNYEAAYENDIKVSEKEQEKINAIKAEIKDIDKQLDKFDSEIKGYEDAKRTFKEQLVKAENILHGAITCPKCSHVFLLDSAGKTLEEVREDKSSAEFEILELDRKIGIVNKKYDKLDSQAADKEDAIKAFQDIQKFRDYSLEKWRKKLKDVKKRLDDALEQQLKCKRNLEEVNQKLNSVLNKSNNICQRMIGEFVGIVEGNVSKGEGYISGCEQNIQFYQGQIKQYEEARDNLAKAEYTDFKKSLEESITQYNEKKAAADAKTAAIQARYDELNGQLTNFSMFKSYLANKKLDALSYIINDFLEQIGSDIRLRLEGYKMLRTGRLKENISIQVLRDGVDIGSYYKRSGGERARLNLASILALQKLTNSNCEEGKGLDIVIADEILDKSDEVGIMSYCTTLNQLHQTSIIITQNQVAEGYPHKVVVTKSKGFSRIDQCKS